MINMLILLNVYQKKNMSPLSLGMAAMFFCWLVIRTPTEAVVPVPTLTKIPRQQYVHTGSYVTFHCRSSLSDIIGYKFYNNGTRVRHQQIASYYLWPIRKFERGNWTCTAESHTVLTPKSNVIDLRVFDVPWLKGPQGEKAYVGTKVTLTCDWKEEQIDGKTVFAYQFYRDDGPNYLATGPANTYELQPIGLINGAIYKCIVLINGSPLAPSRDYHFHGWAPNISATPSGPLQILHTKVVLKCIFVEEEGLQVSYGFYINMGYFIDNGKEIQYGRNNTFVIESVFWPDANTYTCKVTVHRSSYKSNPSSDSYVFSVTNPVKMWMIPVPHGKSGKFYPLHCYFSSALPESNFTIYKYGKVINTHGEKLYGGKLYSFFITDLFSVDSGDYRCEVTRGDQHYWSKHLFIRGNTVIGSRTDIESCRKGVQCSNPSTGSRCSCDPGSSAHTCSPEEDNCVSVCQVGIVCVDTTKDFPCMCGAAAKTPSIGISLVIIVPLVPLLWY